MILSVITNENITSASKTMHSKLKESPLADQRIHEEPTYGFQSTAGDGMDAQRLFWPGDSVRKHGDDAVEQSLTGRR